MEGPLDNSVIPAQAGIQSTHYDWVVLADVLLCPI
jgi:hypothetical protein